MFSQQYEVFLWKFDFTLSRKEVTFYIKFVFLFSIIYIYMLLRNNLLKILKKLNIFKNPRNIQTHSKSIIESVIWYFLSYFVKYFQGPYSSRIFAPRRDGHEFPLLKTSVRIISLPWT